MRDDIIDIPSVVAPDQNIVRMVRTIDGNVGLELRNVFVANGPVTISQTQLRAALDKLFPPVQEPPFKNWGNTQLDTEFMELRRRLTSLEANEKNLYDRLVSSGCNISGRTLEQRVVSLELNVADHEQRMGLAGRELGG